MKIKYRIEKSRPDEAPSIYGEPFFEGKSQEECDKKALEYLEEIGNKEYNAWDNFSLERIDVIEVTTHIARNVPTSHMQNATRQIILRGEKELRT